MGRPLESGLRTAIVAVRLARAMGWSGRELKDVYQVGLLRHVGCTAEAPATAEAMGGDEIAARRWLALSDGERPADVLSAVARNAGARQSPFERARLLAKALRHLPRLAAITRAQGEVAQSLADQVGCGLRVRDALGQAFERWDGTGRPRRRKGDAFCPAMRIVQVADDAQLFHGAQGLGAVGVMLEARGGKGLDPLAAKTMRDNAAELLADLDEPVLWDRAISIEPGAPEYIPPDQLDGALRAVGAFADIQSSYTCGHSTGVADLAAGAAARLGLGPRVVEEVRRAGYVHDVGRAGVSAGVWEKEGPLSPGEWEQVRRHTGYTTQILAHPPMLARLGALGSLDHERLDGTGYTKNIPAGSLPPGARLLAVADMHQAMREARPHRPSIPAGEVAVVLEREAAAGRLDRDAVKAVLETAAAGNRPREETPPGGLSDRERSVLRLASRGLGDDEVATTLGLSTQVVREHKKELYEKIGVTTRAGAAMFAMHHRLLGPEGT